jgi:ferric-dicitrate binding protein FerR (iron transport regulator)
MKPSPCPRLFEGEAMRDGRLGDAERASFERHLTVCPTCLREVLALDALAEAVRAPRGNGEANELHVRRERTRLLAAFDGMLVAPRRQRRLRYRLIWPVAVAALIAGLVISSRPRDTAPLADPTNAVVRPDGATVWSERTEGDLEQVRLERGSLWIQVDHTSGRRRRLVVVLPDGELEDTGTTFTVRVEDGRTTRVMVQDGSITLRVHGQWAVSLGPGETWTPVAQPVASSSSAPAAGPTAPARVAPLAGTSVPSPTSSPSSLAPAAAASALAMDPAVDFRAAMAALDTGDNRRAAATFASFLARHPGDPRAEDAAYLEVIALQRCGDPDAMKVAGQEYLRRFPTGFRHAEVEGSLGDAGL